MVFRVTTWKKYVDRVGVYNLFLSFFTIKNVFSAWKIDTISLNAQKTKIAVNACQFSETRIILKSPV